METCCIVYVNKRSLWSQWLFSGSCIISGVIVLCCYILYSESTRGSLLRKHREGEEGGGVTSQQEFSSDSDPLHLFIKEDKEEENTSAPYNKKDIPLSNLPAQAPPIPDILEEWPKSGHAHSSQPLTHPIGSGGGSLASSGLQQLHSLSSAGGQLSPRSQLNYPVGQLSSGIQINPNHNQLNLPLSQLNSLHNQLNSPRKQLDSPLGQLSSGAQMNPNDVQLNPPQKQFNSSPSDYSTTHTDPLNQSGLPSHHCPQSQFPKGSFTSTLGEFAPGQGAFTSTLGEYASTQGPFTSQKAACTPMKFVKFQDEIVMSSNVDSARLRGEGVASYGDVMAGGMAVNEAETGGRACGTLEIQGDTSSIPVFLCSADVEPSHRTLRLDHPVYENQHIQGVRSHIPGGSKVYPESTNSSHNSSDRYTSSDFERRLPVDPVYDKYSCDAEVHARRLSTDPVLTRITSDLDYILNRSTAEFGSLKRGLGQKGILKKTSSYGKSFEDLRVDARTNL